MANIPVIDIHNLPSDSDIFEAADDWMAKRKWQSCVAELFVRMAQLTYELMQNGIVGPIENIACPHCKERIMSQLQTATQPAATPAAEQPLSPMPDPQ